MNLLYDVWLPVVRKNTVGEKVETVSIWQILDDYKKNPIIDIVAPRFDFRNALYQLLIGIIQVSAAPDNDKEWYNLYYNPYPKNSFKHLILKYRDCFEIDSEKAAFMQDFDLPTDAKEENLDNLFINIPANEHFLHQNESFEKALPKSLNPYWAAVTLYTLQTFAPSGGRGHRVSLRGGGPLTTLLIPNKEDSTLWNKLWLNIINKKDIKDLTGNRYKRKESDIFPWMKETKNSEDGSTLTPNECHPYHMYFGMPRRIRLLFDYSKEECYLTGTKNRKMVYGYLAKHSGNNYAGEWLHPLTPYGVNLKNPNDNAYSRKPKKGGLTYRYWIAITRKTSGTIPAFVVQISQLNLIRRELIRDEGATLWVAGYIMNNMKAENWYETIMPIYLFEDYNREIFMNFIDGIIHSAQLIAINLKSKVKQSWYKSPKDISGDLYFIENAFWQKTESDFYDLLHHLYKERDTSLDLESLYKSWFVNIFRKSLQIFDSWTLVKQEKGTDMKRVIHARNNLESSLNKIRFDFLNKEKEPKDKKKRKSNGKHR